MAAAKSNTNWFAIGVSIAVVVVLVAIGGLVVFLNNQATSPGVAPTANDTFDPETGAISFGDGEDTIAVFVDFQCPVCKTFEDQFGPQLEAAAADGRITLEYHPIAILDRFSQERNSPRARPVPRSASPSRTPSCTSTSPRRCSRTSPRRTPPV